MTTALVQINPAEFGLEESKAKQISDMFKPMLDKMVELETEYNTIVSKQNIAPITCMAAKALRLRYVKIRTGTAAIHRELKAFYLQGGRFVDGWKNAQLMASQDIEKKLADIENYFENIEKIRIHTLGEDRTNSLSEFMQPEFMPPGLGQMDTPVWHEYLRQAEINHKMKLEAERKAEEEFIAKEQAEREERERIKAENTELRKEKAKRNVALAEEIQAKREAEAKEREATAELERIKRENQEREEAERAAKMAREQTELGFNDVDTMSSCKDEMRRIIEKFQFKSEAYQAMFQKLAFVINAAIKEIETTEANL